MDIFTIIKGNLPELPEGVVISEEAIKAMEKEIKSQIEGLEKELAETQGKIAEGESFKRKWEDEKKKFDDFKKSVEAETNERKTGEALRKRLLSDNINPKYADIIIEKTLGAAKLDGDGGIENYDDIVKPHKEQYAEWFTVEEKKSFTPSENPKGNQSEVDLFLQGFDGK